MPQSATEEGVVGGLGAGHRSAGLSRKPGHIAPSYRPRTAANTKKPCVALERKSLNKLLTRASEGFSMLECSYLKVKCAIVIRTLYSGRLGFRSLLCHEAC